METSFRWRAMKTGFSDAQEYLHEYMSEISEFAYCAGWMDGTEYRLWAFMTDDNDDGEWGREVLTTEMRTELRRLSAAVDGWVCWAGAGPVFIPTVDWQIHYASWLEGEDKAAPTPPPP